MDEINTEKNKNEILSQLPEVIDLLNTTLKSGMGLSQSLVTVAALVQGAFGHELKTLFACQSLGVSVEDSWCQLANQHKFPAFQRFARLIILSETTGYSIISALENLALDLKSQNDLFNFNCFAW
jgi:Flp pilus assembly protein TadB